MNEVMHNVQSSTQNERDQQDNIDLVELFHVLWGKLWILILSLVVGAGAAAIGTKMLITPQYEATSMIYVYSNSSINVLQELQIGTQVTADFQIIATTREVIEDVIEELNLNATYESLVGSITISNPSSSHMLQITVKNPDPVLAADISNALADRLREQVAEVMSTDKPSTVQAAVTPTSPCSPNVKKNAVKGGLLCLCLAAGIILLIYLVDDTIKSEEDVARYLNLNTLAAIPLERGSEKKHATGASKRRRKKT